MAHCCYKRVSREDVARIVEFCRAAERRGVFEVLRDPADAARCVIIVSGAIDPEHWRGASPVGAFYCNYDGPGTISLEEDPAHDGMAARHAHAAAIKTVVEALLAEARPGGALRPGILRGLPALES